MTYTVRPSDEFGGKAAEGLGRALVEGLFCVLGAELEEELDALMPALFFHVGFRDVVENLLCVSESMSGSGVPGMAILGISGEGSQGSSSKSFVEELRLEGVLVLDAVVEATVVVRGMLGGLAGRNGMATGSTAPTTGGKGMVSVLQGVFF